MERRGRVEQPRARRAGDAVQLVGALALLAVCSVVAAPPPGFEGAVTRVLTALPAFLDGAWQVVIDATAVLALVVVVGTVVRRRWGEARDLALALVLATALWIVVARATGGEVGPLGPAVRAAGPPPWYPSLRLALTAAVLLTAHPHLTLPVRRLARWAIAACAVALLALEATRPLGALAALLVGVATAAAVHLALGSSAGRPGLAQVDAALRQLGVAVTTLGAADRQPAGVFVIDATDRARRRLVVKVYGRDAHDTALTTALWRRTWYREVGAPLRLGRLQQVEHEAFLTLFAGQAGIATDEVVTAGATSSDDAVLVLRRRGALVADLAADAERAGLVDRMWEVLGRLHTVGVAHGQVDDRHLLVADGGVGLVDFRGATVAAEVGQRRTDEVQALVTAVHLAGTERAVAGALDAWGAEELTAVLPYLQRVLLTPRQRRWAASGDVDLDRLRTEAAAAAGADEPDLVQLRRVSLASIVRVVLPAVAIVLLLSELAGFDLEELAEQVREGSWWLVAVGFVVTQLPRLSQSVSTMGASPVPLPLGPVYALQLAISYINVAIPTGVARVAVNVRFFQRHGVPPAAAVAAGAIDGFGGFVAQMVLLAGLLLFTSASLDLDLDLGSALDTATPILAVVVVVAAVSIAVVAVVGRLRRAVVAGVRRYGGEAWQAVRGLHSPARVAQLIGGNIATEVLFALALATFTHALGSPIGLGTALVVNISVGLLAGLVPVPGGIGVSEGGLTFGLVQAGVPEPTAFAAVLLYRLASFYLPPIWGYVALRWLERNEHI